MSAPHRGYEHVWFDVVIERVEPQRLLAYRWHPHAVDPATDYSVEPTTRVTFTLQDAPGGGTLLTVVESGFDRVRRTAACRRSARTAAAGRCRWKASRAMSAGDGKGRRRGRAAARRPVAVRPDSGAAGVFAALGDPTRLRLVAVLCTGGALSIAQLRRTPRSAGRA